MTHGITITYIYPPIPDRTCDFQATFDDDEPDDNGHMTCGFGRTPLQALIDLLAWGDERRAV